MSEIVSVPYRGATFLNVSEERWEVQEAWDKFPSPIGELHFSIIKVIHYNTLQRV